MKPDLGLTDAQREGVLQILDTVLADEYVLYTKTRNYHWNVTGPHFHDLHKFFKEQYQKLAAIVDEVAERARSLGGMALGNLAEFLKHTRLFEEPGEVPNARGMLERLLADHESMIRNLREDLQTCADKYNDMGTNNFLTDLMEKHEKIAWMFRASLGEGPGSERLQRSKRASGRA